MYQKLVLCMKLHECVKLKRKEVSALHAVRNLTRKTKGGESTSSVPYRSSCARMHATAANAKKRSHRALPCSACCSRGKNARCIYRLALATRSISSFFLMAYEFWLSLAALMSSSAKHSATDLMLRKAVLRAPVVSR